MLLYLTCLPVYVCVNNMHECIFDESNVVRASATSHVTSLAFVVSTPTSHCPYLMDNTHVTTISVR